MKNSGKPSFAGLATISLCAIGIFAYVATSSAHPLAGKKRLADRIGKSSVLLSLVEVATGLTAPNWGTAAPGLPDHLFVTDQVGILWAIDLTTNTKSVYLDVSGLLVPLGFAGEGTFDERGLLGVAFHTDFASNGLLYTFTSEPADSGTADYPTPEGAVTDNLGVVSEWTAADPADPDAGVGPARRVLLRVGEPQFNHAGGAVNFDSAGNLYISLGDGGDANDDVFAEEPDGHTDVIGNGQDLTNVLGAILRIDPLGSDSANLQYGLPAGNPFVGMAGLAPEIFAYGLRNPFRFSIDSDDTLYVGDVGQNDIEEVDHVTAAGQNFGWNAKEGTFCFDVEPDGHGFAFDPEGALCPGDDGSMVDPIAEYDNHLEGHSVIGGFICRGCGISGVEGRYVFGDFAKVFVFTFNDPEQSAFNSPAIRLSVAPGRLFHLDDTGAIVEFKGDSPTGTVLGMGRDAGGAIYVLGNATGLPNGTSGTIHRLTSGGGSGKP